MGHKLTRLLTHLLTLSFTLTHTLIHSLPHSLTHSRTLCLTAAFTTTSIVPLMALEIRVCYAEVTNEVHETTPLSLLKLMVIAMR